MPTIFVFGSNLPGRHDKGAALYAKNQWGAMYGRGTGRQGDSYAIPTRDRQLQPRSLEEIRTSIDEFIVYARENPDCEFLVARVGCGLAGYHDKEIAPMFRSAPRNCVFDPAWKSYLLACRTADIYVGSADETEPWSKGKGAGEKK